VVAGEFIPEAVIINNSGSTANMNLKTPTHNNMGGGSG
jgi:hypothetical protein